MAIIDGINGFKKWVNGADDYDDGYDEGYADNQDVDYSNDFQPRTKAELSSKVVNMNATAQLAVVLVKPEKFENAAEIADNLKNRKTVVLNLENTNKDVARRLIDFLSGVAYANEGKIQRIANSTYIITPYNVDILGDLIDELESSGLYV